MQAGKKSELGPMYGDPRSGSWAPFWGGIAISDELEMEKGPGEMHQFFPQWVYMG
jgi:hypothetical protein